MLVRLLKHQWYKRLERIKLNNEGQQKKLSAPKTIMPRPFQCRGNLQEVFISTWLIGKIVFCAKI